MDNYYRRIIEEYIQCYNNFDTQGMCRNLHQDVVFENIADGRVNLKTVGLKQFSEQAESARHYFRQRKQTVDSWDFEEDKVTVDLSYLGKLAKALPNGMKAGDTLRLKGRSEFLFKDQQIIGIRDIS